jgi:hypothetical protein
VSEGGNRVAAKKVLGAMTVLDKPEGRLSRWREAVFLAFIAVVAVYAALWCFRHEVGLIRPMANMRYFCYGAEAGSFSDQALYWIYAPIYKPYLCGQMLWCGERFEVHWTDRQDGGSDPGP